VADFRTKPTWVTIIITLLTMVLTGCTLFGHEVEEEDPETTAPITRYEGKPSEAVSYVFTTSRKLSLTFNGMGDEATMKKILSELKRYNIKATFFLPGMRVAEEPEIAKLILDYGHEIENNTLNRKNMAQLSYEEIYKEIAITNQIIEREIGVSPKLIRTRSGDYNDDVRLAAAQMGMDAVISYSLNLQGWHSERVEEVKEYVKRHVIRGGVIALNTEGNSQAVQTIPLIAEAAADVKYELVTLSDLMKEATERKALAEIEGFDAAKLNMNDEQAVYDVIKKANTQKKVVALTFDDWGSDFTVTKILDLLNDYDVKASFFLRANGAEHNPNLARAIAEEGHDVANHTYSHPVITTLTPEQLQNEVVKAHHIITEAIQKKPTMLFRPPTGAFDDKTAKVIAATGYTTIAMYDVTTFDWDPKNKAADIIRIINKETTPGSIILLHMLDGLGTLEALPVVIDKLRSQGFTFVPVSEMMEKYHSNSQRS